MAKHRQPKNGWSRRDFVKNALTGVGAAAVVGGANSVEAANAPRHWDSVTDVVIVGAGATGLPAAIEAAENGASVIIVEQNYDIGGHAIESGGNIALGGGTSLQKKYGIDDSPDRMFSDLVHWHDYRFSDREILRAFCDGSAPTFEWLKAHGVEFPAAPMAVRKTLNGLKLLSGPKGPALSLRTEEMALPSCGHSRPAPEN